MTLHRLLFREIVVPLVLSLVLVCGLLVVMQLLQINDVLFGAGFEPLGVLRVAAYLAPHFGVIALPLAFLLAVMLGLGRLSEDNEIVALSALGRSPAALYLVPVAMGLVLGLAVGALAFRGEPWGLEGLHRQLNELIKRNVAGEVRGGTFFDEIPGFTIFVGGVEPDGGWHDVLLEDQSVDKEPLLVLARTGKVGSSGADDALRLELSDGELHREGAKDAYTKARFREASLALGVSGFLARENKFNRPTDELAPEEMPQAAALARKAGHRKTARHILVALGGKFAALLSCLVFGLVAVPLAAGGKGSRGWAFAATVLAFAGYYVVQAIANGLAEGGRLPPMLAAFLPDLLGLAVAALLSRRLWRGPVQGSGR